MMRKNQELDVNVMIGKAPGPAAPPKLARGRPRRDQEVRATEVSVDQLRASKTKGQLLTKCPFSTLAAGRNLLRRPTSSCFFPRSVADDNARPDDPGPRKEDQAGNRENSWKGKSPAA